MTEQPVWSETDSRGFQDPAEIAATAHEEQTRARHRVIACARADSLLWAAAGWAPGLLSTEATA